MSLKSVHKCAVFGCEDRTSKRFNFPNPKTQFQRFLDWFNACKNPQFNGMHHYKIHRNGFICRSHFKDLDMIPSLNNRLHKSAVPSLNLPTEDVENFQAVNSVDLPCEKADKSLTDVEVFFDLPLSDLPFLRSDETPRAFKQFGVLDQFLDETKETIVIPQRLPKPKKPPKKRKKKKKDENDTSVTLLPESDVLPTIVCRLCVAYTFRAFSVTENPKIAEMIESLTSIKIVSNDFQPSAICLKCFLNLKLAYNIQQKMIAVEKHLQQQVDELITQPTKFHLEYDNESLGKLSGKRSDISAPEKCPRCNKKFWNLEMHLNHHNDSGLCEICGISLAPPELALHRKNKHRRMNLKCKFCEMNFISHNLRILHEAREHHEKPKFICERCGKRFYLAQYLKKHLQFTHLKRRPYRCQICNTFYRNRYSLDIHQRKHTQIMPFECHICKKKYAVKKNLKLHLSKVHEIIEALDFECKDCGKRFISEISVNIHRRIHLQD